MLARQIVLVIDGAIAATVVIRDLAALELS